ncbi:MAG: hypothetical protein ACRD1B_08315 [Thermoanaerobaculia bacterium]
MSDVPKPAVAQAILTLLKEAFEGPAGRSTYFIDNDPKAGFLAAIEALTPAEGSGCERRVARNLDRGDRARRISPRSDPAADRTNPRAAPTLTR